MATFRVGVGSFNINDGSVGIGTEGTGHGNLKVEGTIKSTNLDVLGVSTFTRYSGFNADEVNVNNRDLTLSGEYSTTGDIVVEDGASLTVGLGSTACVGSVECISVKHHFSVPVGDTSQRNETSGYGEGTVRYNRDLGTMEFFNGNEWRQFRYQSAIENSYSSRGRGFYVGGFEPGLGHNEITYFDTSSRGNAVMFGELGFNQYSTGGGTGNEVRGIIQGTSEPAGNDQKVEYFTMASEGNGITFGELSSGRGYASGTSTSTRCLVAGGYDPGSITNKIEYAEIMTLGNHLDFGDLTVARNSLGACNTPVRSVFVGGSSPSPYAGTDTIDFVVTASTGNATDFGGLATGINRGTTCHANYTRAVMGTKNGDGAYALELVSGGNVFFFADLVEPNRDGCFNTGNMVRGVIAGGFPAYTTNMEEVMISSGGSATDFGDAALAVATGSSFSDSHGGLGGY